MKLTEIKYCDKLSDQNIGSDFMSLTGTGNGQFFQGSPKGHTFQNRIKFISEHKFRGCFSESDYSIYKGSWS